MKNKGMWGKPDLKWIQPHDSNYAWKKFMKENTTIHDRLILASESGVDTFELDDKEIKELEDFINSHPTPFQEISTQKCKLFSHGVTFCLYTLPNTKKIKLFKK